MSDHFVPAEFACKCGCGFYIENKELISVLEKIREFFEKPVIINSGCRCRHHNYTVGGKVHSYHLTGMAADIRVPEVEPFKVYHYLDRMFKEKYGIICYKTFVHIDVREKSFRMEPHNG